MIHETDSVVLQMDKPELGLEAGDVGTVVHVYGEGAGFEVEFVTLAGHTLGVFTLDCNEVRAVEPGDLIHVRKAEVA